MKIFDPKLTGSIEILNTIQGNVTIAGGLTVDGNLGGSATTASYVEYTDVVNKPTLISSSNQLADSTIPGDLTVTGTLTAQEFHTEFVSGSIIYTSGSTKFGDSSDDKHEFTGSISLSGSMTYGGTGLTIFGQSSDGADNQAFFIGAGGAGSDTRGAYIWGRGNEAVSGGKIQINAGNVSTGNIELYTGGSVRMYVSSSGNVGLGTTSPNERLTVNGAVETLNDGKGEGGQIILRSQSGGTKRWNIDNYSAGNTLRFFTEDDGDKACGCVKVVIQAGGNVGIGTDSPGRKLSVDGSGYVLDSMAVFVPAPSSGFTQNSEYRLTASGNNSGTIRSSNWRINTETDSTFGNSALVFSKSYDGGAFSESLRLLSTGAVALGSTTSPLKLGVVGGMIALSGTCNCNFGVYISPQNENTINSAYGFDAENADLWLNYRGYSDGFTRFRNVKIGDGKANQFAFFQGCTRTLMVGPLSPNGGGRVDVYGPSNTALSAFQARSFAAGTGDGSTCVTVTRAVSCLANNWAVGRYDAYGHVWGYGGSATTTQGMVLNGTNGRLGINTTAPVGRLEVATGGNSDGNVSSWSSDNIVFSKTGGNGTGQGIGFSIDESSQDNTISSLTPAVRWNSLILRAWDWQFFFGSGERFRVDNAGSTFNSTGTYGTLSSDLRLKENVVNATSKLDDILNLRVVNFNYKDSETKDKQLGFIAQEFEQVFPSLVTTEDTRKYDDEGNVTEGYEDSKGLKVGVEFAILTKAIQEQQAIIDDLKARIQTLENS